MKLKWKLYLKMNIWILNTDYIICTHTIHKRLHSISYSFIMEEQNEIRLQRTNTTKWMNNKIMVNFGEENIQNIKYKLECKCDRTSTAYIKKMSL